MTSVTIKEDGRDVVVTDIRSYVEERESIVAKLAPFYARFNEGSVDALAPHEPEIVELINRHEFLEFVIESFEQAGVRDTNILAGWEIVRKHRTGGA